VFDYICVLTARVMAERSTVFCWCREPTAIQQCPSVFIICSHRHFVKYRIQYHSRDSGCGSI